MLIRNFGKVGCICHLAQRLNVPYGLAQDNVGQRKQLNEIVSPGDDQGSSFKANTEGPAGSIFAGRHNFLVSHCASHSCIACSDCLWYQALHNHVPLPPSSSSCMCAYTCLRARTQVLGSHADGEEPAQHASQHCTLGRYENTHSPVAWWARYCIMPSWPSLGDRMHGVQVIVIRLVRSPQAPAKRRHGETSSSRL